MTMVSKLLLFMLLGMAEPSMYYLDIQTSFGEHAATTGPVHFELEGTGNRKLNFGAVKDLKRDSLQRFSLQSADKIGTIECISFKMESDDAWMPEYIAAWSSYDHEKAYVYSRKKQYSTDPKEGPDHAKLCKEGDTSYVITTTTASKKWAGTDNIWASVEIEGSEGSTETGILDNKHENDRERGDTNKFVFPGMHNVGIIKCIVVKVRADDLWYFTKITVQKLGSSQAPVTFRNTAKTRMSSDSKEGVSSLKLC